IPFARYGGHFATCRPVLVAGRTDRSCLGGAGVYWPIALVLAYTAIAVFYIRRSRARGVGTRVRPYATAGIIVAGLGAAPSGSVPPVRAWPLHSPPPRATGAGPLAGPGATIGRPLLVLAGPERTRAPLALTVGYLAIALIPASLGWGIRLSPPWGFLPYLI